jgi:hypothetical protein
LRDPISKVSNTKRAGGVAQGTDPEFKPQYYKKKKIVLNGWRYFSDFQFLCILK